MQSIKVNFPANERQFLTGNGERMWVIVDDATKAAYDKDEDRTVYEGVLDNQSIYYPELKPGTKVKFEMRGEHAPVAILGKYNENL